MADRVATVVITSRSSRRRRAEILIPGKNGGTREGPAVFFCPPGYG
jgi:hypothetical protein